MSSARSFSVNPANFIKIAPATQSAALNTANKVSLSMWVKFTNPAAAGDSLLYRGMLGYIEGEGILIDARQSAGQKAQVRVRARSATESLKASAWTGPVITHNVWTHLGVVIDYQNMSIKIFVDGVQKVSTGATFWSESYKAGSAHPRSETFAGGTKLQDVMYLQTACDMTRVAIWKDDIQTEFPALAAGGDAATTRPDVRALYFPLDGSTPEVETVIGATLTLGGSVPVVAGPSVLP